MSNPLLLAQNDFRLAYRDPMLRLMLALPLLILLLVWFIVPLLRIRFPHIADFQQLILMGACLQTPVMFGFINGFLFLEEKEQGVFQALQVVPLSPGQLLLNRNMLGIALSFVVNLVLLLSSNLLQVSLLPALLLTLQYALLGPCLCLLVLVFAQNKVQGLAQFKVYNLFALLPILVFFLPHAWIHVLGIVPTYWSFRAISQLTAGSWLPSLLMGFGMYALYLVGLLFWYKKHNQ